MYVRRCFHLQVSALGSPSGPSRPVYFPAGVYMVNSSLTVVSTHRKDALPLRLYGDGVRQTVIMAGAEMDAVLRFEGYGPSGGTPGMTTNGHVIESMKVDAAAKANYSVAAPAITRSLFRFSDFSGARIAGLFLGCEHLDGPAAAVSLHVCSSTYNHDCR